LSLIKYQLYIYIYSNVHFLKLTTVTIFICRLINYEP